MKNTKHRGTRPRSTHLKPIRDMGLLEGVHVLHARFKARNWWLDADTTVRLAKMAGAGKRSAPINSVVGKRAKT